MKILALEKELHNKLLDPVDSLLKAEAERLWELQQSGFVREAYFNENDHTAVLVLESINIETARLVLSSLPLVETGWIEFEVIPLVPYNGYARLFTREI